MCFFKLHRSFGTILNGFKNQVIRNAIANFIAFGWLSLLSMLFVPIYIRFLGVTEWGIVAACASVQVFANFVDAGFSQIVPRWVAREAGQGLMLFKYLRLFQKIYLILGLFIFFLLQLSANYLAHKWYQVEADDAAELELALRIISFQFLFQFVNNLYIGFWHGMQKQVLANVRTCFFGTLKHAVTLFALKEILPVSWVYASVFSFVALIEVVINRITLRRMLGAKQVGELPQILIAPFLREVSVLSGGIMVGLLVSQLDRIVLSRILPLEQFGIYTVTATLALAFLQLQAPFTRAYFPILVRELHVIGRVSGKHIKHLVLGTLMVATLPTLLASLFSAPLLQVWLHESSIVEIAQRPLQLLLIAVAINTLYGCIYQLIVASGQSHLVFNFNVTALLVAIVIVFVSGYRSGSILGGIIWLSTASTQLVLGLFWFLLKRHQFVFSSKEV